MSGHVDDAPDVERWEIAAVIRRPGSADFAAVEIVATADTLPAAHRILRDAVAASDRAQLAQGSMF